MILLLFLALSLGACRNSDAPADPVGAVVTKPPPETGEPYRLTAVLLDSPHGEELRALTPAGTRTLHLGPNTRVAPGVTRGTYVDAECRIGANGELKALAIETPKGLPVTFGTIRSISDTEMVVENVIETITLAVNPMSDLSPGLAPGVFVDAKYYDMAGQPTILNARPQPGHFETWGLVRAVDASGASIQSLKQEDRFELGEADRAAITAGDQVLVSWTEGPDETRDILEVRKVPELRFIGKYVEMDPSELEMRLVDTWRGTLGAVTLRVSKSLGLGQEVVPGDLLEVTYAFLPDQTSSGSASTKLLPTAISYEKRKLSPIYFGRVTELDESHITVITLQKQSRTVRITSETLFPHPVAVGELADVVYRQRSSEMAEARLVVKE